MSIPGMSFNLVATIIGELDDVSRFPNFRSVIAFSGLDNAVYQSGTEIKHGKISKRGSKLLRVALYQASLINPKNYIIIITLYKLNNVIY